VFAIFYSTNGSVKVTKNFAIKTGSFVFKKTKNNKDLFFFSYF